MEANTWRHVAIRFSAAQPAMGPSLPLLALMAYSCMRLLGAEARDAPDRRFHACCRSTKLPAVHPMASTIPI